MEGGRGCSENWPKFDEGVRGSRMGMRKRRGGGVYLEWDGSFETGVRGLERCFGRNKGSGFAARELRQPSSAPSRWERKRLCGCKLPSQKASAAEGRDERRDEKVRRVMQ